MYKRGTKVYPAKHCTPTKIISISHQRFSVRFELTKTFTHVCMCCMCAFANKHNKLMGWWLNRKGTQKKEVKTPFWLDKWRQRRKCVSNTYALYYMYNTISTHTSRHEDEPLKRFMWIKQNIWIDASMNHLLPVPYIDFIFFSLRWSPHWLCN